MLHFVKQHATRPDVLGAGRQRHPIVVRRGELPPPLHACARLCPYSARGGVHTGSAWGRVAHGIAQEDVHAIDWPCKPGFASPPPPPTLTLAASRASDRQDGGCSSCQHMYAGAGWVVCMGDYGLEPTSHTHILRLASRVPAVPSLRPPHLHAATGRHAGPGVLRGGLRHGPVAARRRPARQPARLPGAADQPGGAAAGGEPRCVNVGGGAAAWGWRAVVG